MTRPARASYDWVLFDLGGTLFDDLPPHYSEHNQRKLLRDLGATSLAQTPEVRQVFRVARRVADARFLRQPAYTHKTLVATHALLALNRLDLTQCDDWESLVHERPPPQHNRHCSPDNLIVAVDAYFNRQAHSVVTNVRIKRGCHEALAQIARKHQLAVVSNNAESYLRPLLKRYRLESLFAGAFTSDALGACKPNPHIFDRAFARLNITDGQQHRLLYVGDSPDHDVGSALAAGMDVALLVDPKPDADPHKKGTSPNPTYVIHSLPELAALLAN